jgi:glutathione synthase/RimK-type ligase-like ATP-grasp enzyme
MSLYPKIVFLTNREDFTSDYLISRLISRANEICYLRLNSEDIVHVRFEHNSREKTLISFESIEYDLSKTKSIYFRRAPTIFPPPSDVDDTAFINRERRDFLEGILLSLNAKWINPLFSTIRGERKLYQLSLANRIGLKTPLTLVTNDPQKIKEFITNKQAIIKPISHGLQITNRGSFSMYTNSITQSDILDNSQLYEVPSFIQEQIENKNDIRVTIIDKSIFAVAIRKEPAEEIDWRKPNIKKAYSLINLPDILCKKLLRLNMELGLRYSAIDLIQTPTDDFVFLEVNPAGEWVWLERELDLSISSQILKSLMG